MTIPTEAIVRLEVLAADSGPSLAPYKDHNGFDQYDRMRADLRTLLAELAEARKVIEPFGRGGQLAILHNIPDDSLRPFGQNFNTGVRVDNLRRASEFIRRVEGK